MIRSAAICVLSVCLTACSDRSKHVSLESLLPNQVYTSGHQTGEFPLYEMMGGGIAVLDLGQDGDMDLIFSQPKGAAASIFTNQLMQTERLAFIPNPYCQLNIMGVGMGLAVGDFDNDGIEDLFFSNLNANQLAVGVGDCFTPVDNAIQPSETWASSAAFWDWHNDGDLDLFVANYVDVVHGKCFGPAGTLDYCSPSAFTPYANQIIKNDNSILKHVSTPTLQLNSPSLGVIALHADSDAYIDILVANDGDHNELWHSSGTDALHERGLMSGIAVNAQGHPEAGMGIAVGDIDLDGNEEVLMTHLDGETHTLYKRTPGLGFEDATSRFGMDRKTEGRTGFGVAFVDVNADGYLDLFVANGAILADPQALEDGDPYPYKQRNQLWINDAGQLLRWESELDKIAPLSVSRGLATGDFDNDGDQDIVVSNIDAPAEFWLNNGNPKQWLGLDVREHNGRVSIGAEVRIQCPDQRQYYHMVRYNKSYLSASDPRIAYALNNCPQPKINIHWPTGERCSIHDLETNQYLRVYHNAADTDGLSETSAADASCRLESSG